MGSKGGLQFIERFDLVSDFLWFCQDGGYFLQNATPQPAGTYKDDDMQHPGIETSPDTMQVPHRDTEPVSQTQSQLVHHSEPGLVPNFERTLTLCSESKLEPQPQIKMEPQPENEPVPRPNIKLVSQSESNLIDGPTCKMVSQPDVKPAAPSRELVLSRLSTPVPHSTIELTERSEIEPVSGSMSNLALRPDGMKVMKTMPNLEIMQAPGRKVYKVAKHEIYLLLHPKTKHSPSTGRSMVPHSRISHASCPFVKQIPNSEDNKVSHPDDSQGLYPEGRKESHTLNKVPDISQEEHHDVKLVSYSAISQTPVCEIMEPLCHETKLIPGVEIGHNTNPDNNKIPAALNQQLQNAYGKVAQFKVLNDVYNKDKHVMFQVTQPGIGQIPYTETKQMALSGKEPEQDPLKETLNDVCSYQISLDVLNRKKKQTVKKLDKITKKSLIIPAKTKESDECHKTHAWYESIEKHISTFKCVHCDEDFISMKALVQHEVVHDDMNCRNCYKCNLCDRKYPKFYNFNRHLKRTHPQQYSDKLKTFKTSTSQETFPCSKCNKTFHFAHALYIHNSKMHAPEKLSLKCVNCEKDFKFVTLLMKHEATAHKNMTSRNYHHCIDCGKKFTTFISFYYHRRRFHSDVPYKPHDKCKLPPLLCSICGKAYNRYTLKKHMEQVHSTIIFTCEVCNKSFKSANNLKKHESIHSVAKSKYICDICGFTTRHGSCLWKHKIRHHSTERPHKCEFCDRSYCFPSELLAHKRSHPGNQNAPLQ